MNGKRSLLGSGWSMVMRNQRYIFWFWLLNLTLAEFGTSMFRKSAHAILDHSLYAERLVHGFDLAVLLDLMGRQEFPSTSALATTASYFGFIFFLATAIFLPGIFAGYASTYRLPREDFFRACGRNLWRFIRLMIIAAIVMGIFSGILFAINGAIVSKAGESTNERLPFQLQMIGTLVIFLVLTLLRVWFDLAEVDVVLNDQRAVRKSLATALRHIFRSGLRLLANYVVATVLAVIFLVGGIWCWIHFVSSESIVGAFLLVQLILLLLLIPRFWQRGIAVAYWQQRMLAPIVVAQSVIEQPVPPSPAPEIAPVAPETSPTQSPGIQNS